MMYRLSCSNTSVGKSFVGFMPYTGLESLKLNAKTSQSSKDERFHRPGHGPRESVKFAGAALSGRVCYGQKF